MTFILRRQFTTSFVCYAYDIVLIQQSNDIMLHPSNQSSTLLRITFKKDLISNPMKVGLFTSPVQAQCNIWCTKAPHVFLRAFLPHSLSRIVITVIFQLVIYSEER